MAGGPTNFKSDDLGAAMWEDFKWAYEPAFNGDMGETWRRVREHPLGPILDVASVFGLAAGVAPGLAVQGVKMTARAVPLAARISSEGAAAGRVGTLQRVGGYEWRRGHPA